MNLTKTDCEHYFNVQFTNSMCGLSKKAPYASFGPFVIKYEPQECGPFTEVHWRVYLFDGSDKTLKSGVCPIGRLTPIFEKKFDYMPFAQEIWYRNGNQIFNEFNKWLKLNRK